MGSYIRCEKCTVGCSDCNGLGWIIEPKPESDTVSDLRIALAETFEDYAKHTENYFEAEVWRKAADIARSYVTRRVVKI